MFSYQNPCIKPFSLSALSFFIQFLVMLLWHHGDMLKITAISCQISTQRKSLYSYVIRYMNAWETWVLNIWLDVNNMTSSYQHFHTPDINLGVFSHIKHLKLNTILNIRDMVYSHIISNIVLIGIWLDSWP